MQTRELEGHFEKVMWTLFQYRKFFSKQPLEVYATEAIKSLDTIEYELLMLKILDHSMYETMVKHRHMFEIRDLLDMTDNKPKLILPPKTKDKDDPNSL